MRARPLCAAVGLLTLCLLGCAQVLDIRELGYRADDEADAELPASCRDADQDCGANADTDCCATGLVSGGEFLRDAKPQYPAVVSDFALDLHEVTVRRFRAFVEAGQGTQLAPPVVGTGAHPALDGSGWRAEWDQRLPATRERLEELLLCTDTFRFWSSEPSPHDLRPMNCLTWYLAFAFCSWDGGRLPTEAEWTFAASAGSEQWSYPWGEQPPSPELAAYNCQADGSPDCSFADVVQVGTLPLGKGRFGQFDLGGNVLEWLLDAYDSYPVPCRDCANLTELSDRITRGGFYGEAAVSLSNDQRGHSSSTLNTAQVGVRCARTKSLGTNFETNPTND